MKYFCYTVLITIATVISVNAQQWHFTALATDNAIAVITPDSQAVAFKKVKEILGGNGFDISRDDPATGTLSTSLKPIDDKSQMRIRVGMLCGPGGCTIRWMGYLKPTVTTGYISGDNSVPVTPVSKARWQDVLKLAQQYGGGTLKYGKLN